jgi:hypothetical protein
MSCHSDGSGKEKSVPSVGAVQSDLNSDFTISTPAGWTQEIHSFPLDFADQIPYKGYSDVRFPTGWGNAASGEFWAYLSVWWVTDTAALNEETLGVTLRQYYTGLARKSRPGTIRPSDSASLATANVTKVKADSSDIATYNARANIYDGNISMSRLDLNFKIHVIACGKGKVRVVIFEISPKGYANPIWVTLDKIKSTFKCGD